MIISILKTAIKTDLGQAFTNHSISLVSMPVMHQNSHGQRVLKQISVPRLKNKYTTTRKTTESQITSKSANSYHSAICKHTIMQIIVFRLNTQT